MKIIPKIIMILFLITIRIGYSNSNENKIDEYWKSRFSKETFIVKLKERKLSVKHWSLDGTYKREGAKFYWVIFADDGSGLNIGDLIKDENTKSTGVLPIDGVLMYRVKIESYAKSLEQFKRHSLFINVVPVEDEDKTSWMLNEWHNGRGDLKDKDEIRVAIRPVEDFSGVNLAEYIQHLADSITVDQGPCIGDVTGIVDRRKLTKLLSIPEVMEVDIYSPPEVVGDVARPLARVSNLQNSFIDTINQPSPLWNANTPYVGDSVWIGIWDEGIDSLHGDFKEGNEVRKAQITGNPYAWRSLVSYHGTHVAGIALGNGWRSQYSNPLGGSNGWISQWRGIAPKARTWAFGMYVDGNYADVNNHSHVIGYTGTYTDGSKNIDNATADHNPINLKNNIMVYAAANNGGFYAQHGSQRGYYSLLADSKNAIKVGSVEKHTGLRSDISSMGPTRDGRLGPDVMAPGSGGDVLYKMEFDSIVVKGTNGTKKAWYFGNSNEIWLSGDCARNRSVTNGVFSVYVNSGTTIYSPISPSIIGSSSDTLIFRWKVSKLNSVPSSRIPAFYVQYDGGSLVFETDAPSIWQVKKVHIGSQTVYKGSSWNGASITSLGFCIGVNDLPASGIVSCWSNNSYSAQQGTSMAAPFVSGVVALMLQKYRDSYNKNIHNEPFWNSTARALLIHTATDMVNADPILSQDNNPDFVGGDATNDTSLTTPYTIGPDYATGYGLVNAEKAVTYVDTFRFKESQIRTGETKCYFVDIGSNRNNFRATIAWDDTGALNLTSPMDKKLINDIDLKVVNLQTGENFYPWTIDHSPIKSSTIPSDGIDRSITRELILANPAFKGRDTLNNVEVVDIANPTPGKYMIVVQGTKIIARQNPRVSGTAQDFSLVCDTFISQDIGQFGISFSYKGNPKMKQSMTGNMLLSASSCFQSGNHKNLLIRYNGTTYASLDSLGVIHASSVVEEQGSWLDVPGNLISGLIFKSVEGNTKLHIGNNSVIKIRGFRNCNSL